MGSTAEDGVSVGDWTAAAAARLADAGVETARLDARLLMAHVMGGDVARVVAESRATVSADQLATLDRLLARRQAREPMSHILGRREFWGLDFTVTPATLTPRPDTETVIEAVLDARPDKGAPLRILDLGTGTGCLLLALLHEYPAATGLGIDVSADALAVAEKNAVALGLAGRATFDEGVWCQGVEGTFDVVVSNPPYIPDDDILGLMTEVSAYEPIAALRGGSDGLDAYRQISSELPKVMKQGAGVFFEVGDGQADAVAAILREGGFSDVSRRADLGGRERCISAICQG